ncbi:hypothetical protein SF83666_c08230 [Sinorhizobium fredii CCBAU 83666]|nr:hypothetical protein SF83666_c08230 [Sinorhizobium fredii CCBAU 83666]
MFNTPDQVVLLNDGLVATTCDRISLFERGGLADGVRSEPDDRKSSFCALRR